MRLLIVRLSAIGDVLHALPALEVLRQAFPRDELGWVVEPPASRLLEGHPALDRLLVIDRPALVRGPRRLRALRDLFVTLRSASADVALDLQGLLRSALVARATGAGRSFGPAWAREGARHLYTDPLDLPRPPEAHAVERYVRAARATARALGAHVEDGPTPRARLRGPVDVAPQQRACVVLLPGAGKPANRPPASLLAEVADHVVRARPDAELVLVGGRGDNRRAGAVISRCRVAQPVDRTGGTSLSATAQLLATAHVVIGGDTGPLHLARVLGRPVVALFHAADPARTGPGGLPGDSAVHVVRGEAPCAPCCARRCERSDRVRICLRALRAEEIARLAIDHLR